MYRRQVERRGRVAWPRGPSVLCDNIWLIRECSRLHPSYDKPVCCNRKWKQRLNLKCICTAVERTLAESNIIFEPQFDFIRERISGDFS